MALICIFNKVVYCILQTRNKMKCLYNLSWSTTVLTTVLLTGFVKQIKSIPDPHQREKILQQETSEKVGGRVELTPAERKLDSLLHKLKEKEMQDRYFLPAMHFFKAKPYIEKSQVFKLLKKMPKGNGT